MVRHGRSIESIWWSVLKIFTSGCNAGPTELSRRGGRAWIPKSGVQRPLGIAALEDKIVQQAVRRVLEEIFEVEFVGFSYGFRPERSAHNALDALWGGSGEAADKLGARL
jgi:hypothetical protein